MPIKSTDKIIQAGLPPEDYEKFKEVAIKKGWSDKRLTERILKLFLSQYEKRPSIINNL